MRAIVVLKESWYSFVRAMDPNMKSEIQRCIDHALDGSNMVKNANQIMEKLRSLGLMQRMQLHPKMVGIHPRNRDGAGVSPQEVHCLLDDIIDHGIVKSKVEAVGNWDRGWRTETVEQLFHHIGWRRPWQARRWTNQSAERVRFAHEHGAPSLRWCSGAPWKPGCVYPREAF